MDEPKFKRVIAFIDGQNLFRAAKEAFGSRHPDFDPSLLAANVCDTQGWSLEAVRFYTGVPPADRDPFWHVFWSRKLAQMGKQGVRVFSRPLRYQRREFRFGHGGSFEAELPVEKGVDVRIAIDVIRLAIRASYEVALIFSQDQDLSEVADEVKLIGQEQNRWLRVASAFPTSPARPKHALRGINHTQWIKIDQALYDRCRDYRDYRPPR